MMKKGIVYGVGVGPGDPELMTLKAIRIIRENEVIAVAGASAEQTLAYRIAVQAVPELETKELLPLHLPMGKDAAANRVEHRRGVHKIEALLEQGKNVVYLTLGDPAVYSSFSYLQHILQADGYTVQLVSGITSFCAAAACLNLSLAEWDEPLHILPALHMDGEETMEHGNYVLMKAASRMKDVKVVLRKNRKSVCAVENCGMPAQKVYRALEEIPDDAGYFSLIIAKEPRLVHEE